MFSIKKFMSYLRGLRFASHISKLSKKGQLYLYPKCKLFLSNQSNMQLDGNLIVGANAIGHNGRSSILRMDKGSRLELSGNFEIYYGADIILFPGSKLVLNSGFINSDCKIRCHDTITIGSGCAISHDFTVMDSNAHSINGSKGAKPVKIGNHVWVGTRVTILPGVTIGDNAVIAAGAVVTKDIPAGCLAAGVPATVKRENIIWEG